jgi:predicted Zn-dependent peptidase
MKSGFLSRLGGAATAASLALGLLWPARAAALELPFTKSKLRNGLTVIIHEDHTLPQVAVNLAYRVGSRDEETRRTGFAHLFEHLMFMGTSRVPPKMFDAWMEAAGGANNAWTSNDLTDYHESGPPGSLPLLLWLEADRLVALGREMDKAKLDLQRDVVRNERRQSIENVPYGKVELRLPELLYPDRHPYHHPVIGSHEDLEAASVDDVKRFFDKYYVPENASLVVAGDVRAADVSALVERYFGGIPAGQRPERARPSTPPPLGKIVRETMSDQVELPKLVIAFHSPERMAAGDADLDLLSAILSTGKASRLSKALVIDHPLAQSVSVSQSSQDLSSYFSIEVIARPGVALDDLEKAVDAVLTEVIDHGPTEEELRRARNSFEYRFVDQLQSLAARARQLNMYEVQLGDPGFVDRDLARYRGATVASVGGWAKKVLTMNDRVILRVVPKDAPADPPKKPGGKKGGKR